MRYVEVADELLKLEGVHLSTVMNFPCLRYRGEFMTMMLVKASALLVKIPADRVNELIAEGKGEEFRPAGKKFREWVVIPDRFEDDYEALMYEALQFAKDRKRRG